MLNLCSNSPEITGDSPVINAPVQTTNNNIGIDNTYITEYRGTKSKMNRKRNVSFIKPEDPHFLKVLKKEAGYDNSNHKFDKLDNAEDDFVDDEDSELPQVVVLKKGDLTAEEAEAEKERIKKVELETKADLSQKVIFKGKPSKNIDHKKLIPKQCKDKNRQLLSFTDDASDSDT